jgi:hypothetical protein
VYVFEKNSTGQYEQVSKLVASDGSKNALFGHALAVTTGGILVVGAPMDGGSVYVFEKNSTGQYEQVSKLVASDGPGGQFGIAVAATGSTVMVGAWFDNPKGSLSGSVYVFEKNSTGQYEQVSKLVASDGTRSNVFGNPLAVTSGLLMIGAYGVADQGSQSGAMYVFEKNSTGQYEQVSKVVASDGAAGDKFGNSLAAINTTVIVGSPGDEEDTGSVYVFE